MEIQALGLIEVNGFLGAVAASDAALKTADVKLVNAEKIRGGLTTIQLSGDVAAVQVAVEAGAAAARALNSLLSSHVIPRLSNEAAAMVTASRLHQPVAVVAETRTVLEEPKVDAADKSEVAVKPQAKQATVKQDELSKKKK